MPYWWATGFLGGPGDNQLLDGMETITEFLPTLTGF